MLIAVSKKYIYCVICYNFRHIFVPYANQWEFSVYVADVHTAGTGAGEL